MLKRFAFATILLTATIIIGCKKDTTPTPVVVTGSFDLMQQKILTPSCAVVGCHNSTADRTYAQHKLVLTGADVHTQLFNGSVANAQAVAAGLKQIAPSDTAKSFFFQKLNFNQSRHKYGSAMPLGADILTAKQIEFVRQWILAGAPKTGAVFCTGEFIRPSLKPKRKLLRCCICIL
jgi:hypothetical protein